MADSKAFHGAPQTYLPQGFQPKASDEHLVPNHPAQSDHTAETTAQPPQRPVQPGAGDISRSEVQPQPTPTPAQSTQPTQAQPVTTPQISDVPQEHPVSHHVEQQLTAAHAPGFPWAKALITVLVIGALLVVGVLSYQLLTSSTPVEEEVSTTTPTTLPLTEDSTSTEGAESSAAGSAAQSTTEEEPEPSGAAGSGGTAQAQSSEEQSAVEDLTSPTFQTDASK